MVSTLIVLFFSLPTFYAYKINIPGKVFSGNSFLFDSSDINVYVAAIRWSQKNGFNFQNAFTTKSEGNKVILYPLYTALGIMFPKIEPYVLYNLMVIITSYLALYTIFYCAGVLSDSKSIALTSLFLVPLAGGFGWLLSLRVVTPDFYTTPFTFFNVFERPHEMLALSFYIASLTFFFASSKSVKMKNLILSILFTYLFLIFYPYLLASFYLIAFIFTGYKYLKSKDRDLLKNFGVLVILTLPFAGFYSLWLLQSKGFGGVLIPNLYPPKPLNVVLGYGVLFVFFIYQLVKVKKDDRLIFLNIWFLFSLILTYTPFSFSRYYLRGLFFPLTIIFLLTLKEFLPGSSRLRELYKITIFTLISLTSIFLFVIRIRGIKTGFDKFFLDRESIELFSYLRSNTQPESGVLASYPLANYIPPNTYNRVYYGHPNQTPEGEEKLFQQNKFYQGNYSETEGLAFLKENNIDYVVTNSKEKLPYLFLFPIYKNPKLALYKVLYSFLVWRRRWDSNPRIPFEIRFSKPVQLAAMRLLRVIYKFTRRLSTSYAYATPPALKYYIKLA